MSPRASSAHGNSMLSHYSVWLMAEEPSDDHSKPRFIVALDDERPHVRRSFQSLTYRVLDILTGCKRTEISVWPPRRGHQLSHMDEEETRLLEKVKDLLEALERSTRWMFRDGQQDVLPPGVVHARLSRTTELAASLRQETASLEGDGRLIHGKMTALLSETYGTLCVLEQEYDLRITHQELREEYLEWLADIKAFTLYDVQHSHDRLSEMAQTLRPGSTVPKPEHVFGPLSDYLLMGKDEPAFGHESTGADVLSNAIEYLSSVASGEAETQDDPWVEVDIDMEGSCTSPQQVTLDPDTDREFRRLSKFMSSRLRNFKSAQQQLWKECSVMTSKEKEPPEEQQKASRIVPRVQWAQ